MVPACALQMHGATLGCISQWAASLQFMFPFKVGMQNAATLGYTELFPNCTMLGLSAFITESSLFQVELFTVGLFQNQCSTYC